MDAHTKVLTCIAQLETVQMMEVYDRKRTTDCIIRLKAVAKMMHHDSLLKKCRDCGQYDYFVGSICGCCNRKLTLESWEEDHRDPGTRSRL